MTSNLDIPQFTTARSSHPWLIRSLNTVGKLWPSSGAISPDSIWEKARAKGCEDCEPTPEAREALAVLLDSLAASVKLSLVGRFSAIDDTVRLARTHLRIHRALRETPEIESVSLPPPIFVIGWPRTGSTFLHLLLAQDPVSRTIPYWESFDPVGPAEGEPDRRIEKLDEMLGLLRRIAPRYDAIHPMTAEMTEECVALFMNEFRTLQMDFQYRVPEYADWLRAQDADIAYRLHEQQLKLIQHRRPYGIRQVLKDPTHIMNLPTIAKRYPNAKFVFTHRDPAFAISSICSLVAYTRALFSDEVDPREIGREIMSGYWPTAIEEAQDFRSGLSEGCYVDVRHEDLSRDPVATASNIYARLGLEESDEMRQSVDQFLENRRAETVGKHVHALPGFGLTDEGVRDRFKAYCERFDL